MADKKNKEKEQPQLRVPKAKTSRFGLKVPTIRMPHEDLIKPEFPKAVPEIVLAETELPEEIENDKGTMPSHTGQSTHTSQTRHTRQSDIAPIKNFQKVPNSITKSAIPDGLFKPGKSKHLYDIVYSLTRGAIEPKRIIRMSKTKLRKLAGIGSRITFDSCVDHLEIVGLLKVTVHIGEHEGNEFEVFLPEEITMPSHTSQSSQSSQTRHAQNLDTLVSLESSQTSHSSEPINTGISDASKTLIKTYKNDDEAFAKMTAKLSAAVEGITGKKPGKKDEGNWEAIADLLTAELKRANENTTVIDPGAFLRTHLERAFLRERSKVQSTKFIPDTIGAPHQVHIEPQPLDEQGRLNALDELRDYSGEVLDVFELRYTKEDWEWLTDQLKKEKENDLTEEA